MTLHERQCAVCQKTRHEDQIAGEMWYGDPVGVCCIEAIEECRKCGYYIEAHQVKERDNEDYAICPECLPKYGEDARCDYCGKLITYFRGTKLLESLGQRTLCCGRCDFKRTGGVIIRSVRKHPKMVENEQLDEQAQDARVRDE
jgi:hypothetical protein